MDATLLPPFGVFATLGLLTLWVIWLFLVGIVIHDVFTTRELSGAGKALWLLTVIVLPLAGVVVYLAVRGGSMPRRAGEELTPRAPRTAERVPSAVAPMEGGR